MPGPPTTQRAANDEPSQRNGSRDIAASTEKPQFSSLFEQRMYQTVVDELRSLTAIVRELASRLPAPIEVDADEYLDIRFLLRTPSDEELVARLGVEGILDALRALRGPYLQIKSIRFIPKPSPPASGSEGPMMSDRCASLLIIVETYQAEYEIRNSSSQIKEAVPFSPNCVMLPRKYQVLIPDFDKDWDRGTFPDWTAFFKHYTRQDDIQVRVTFQRFLIETTSLETALLICRTSIKVGHTTFKAM